MRYFFDLSQGGNRADTEGLELPDVDAAREEAIRTSGEIIRDCGPELRSGCSEWRMTVKDAAGNELLQLAFSIRDLTPSD